MLVFPDYSKVIMTKIYVKECLLLLKSIKQHRSFAKKGSGLCRYDLVKIQESMKPYSQYPIEAKYINY